MITAQLLSHYPFLSVVTKYFHQGPQLLAVGFASPDFLFKQV